MKWWYVSRLRKFHLKFQKFIRVPPYDFENLMSTFLQYKYIGCLILGQINFWKKIFGPRSPQFSGITTPRLRFAQEHSDTSLVSSKRKSICKTPSIAGEQKRRISFLECNFSIHSSKPRKLHCFLEHTNSTIDFG